MQTEDEMTLQQALCQLGVRDDTLTAAEKAQLDTEGYVLLQGILSADEVSGVRAALEGVYAVEYTGQKDGPAESSLSLIHI